MNSRQDNLVLPDFGEPIDSELLLGFAVVDSSDVESALQWFDDHASEEWRGVLEAKPIDPKRR